MTGMDLIAPMGDAFEAWTGKAGSYDRACPEPPPALLDLLTQLIDMPGGLFAAYDYDAPPTVQWELDRLAQEMTRRFVELIQIHWE